MDGAQDALQKRPLRERQETRRVLRHRDLEFVRLLAVLLDRAVNLALDALDEGGQAIGGDEARKGVRVAVEEAVEDDDRLVRGNHLELTALRDADEVEQNADDARADDHLADRLVHVDVRQHVEEGVDELGGTFGCARRGRSVSR